MEPGSIDEYFRMAAEGTNVTQIVVIFFAQLVILILFFTIMGYGGTKHFYIRYPIYIICLLMGIHGLYFADGALTTFLKGVYPGGLYFHDTIQGMGMGVMLAPLLFIYNLYRYHQNQLED